MSHPLLAAEAGVRHLLLGNEAIVRGALEAGINVVTCYPGTPSSEIPDTFHYLASCGRYRMEYSVNEKVAVEVGAGAALAGAMSMTTMKHVGVNVAADPLFTAAYVGLPGGFVLVSADDPLCHSSQDEQDNRTYARFMGMPCFEPATAQEAKDMTREALLLARELQQPVMLRTTTRVNHLRGPVTFGALGEPAPIVPFERNPMRFVPVPAVAQGRHKVLVEHLENARAKAEASPWNKVSGEGRIGVIASGISRAYLADALAENGWEKDVKVLELGFTWPLPENLLADFMSGCDTVLVLEELQPLVEQDLRALAQERKIDVSIVGKGPDLTIFGEYSTGAVARALAAVLGKELPSADGAAIDVSRLPGRPPNLCAGCSHRAMYYAVRKVFGDEAVYSSDIGCYTLGNAAPLNMVDTCLCMGAGITIAQGLALAEPGTKCLAFIGDSTFFASGITGVVNAVYNGTDIILIVLDNSTTAMTGHQPHPGTGVRMMGDVCEKISIEKILRAIGLTSVETVDPLDNKAAVEAVKHAAELPGVKAIIFKSPCIAVTKPSKRFKIADSCVNCKKCIRELGCPAIVMENGRISAKGTHDELMKASDIYREVYEQQTNGGDKDEQ